MDPNRYRRIKEIVMRAMEVPADQLQSILAEECGNDSDLRAEVEELLDLDVGETFLAQSPVETSLIETPEEDLTGQIGRIRIGERLARGGMGDVYEGVDELLERPVAIKIMTAELRLSAARRSAFLNEAKLLSSLQHPNICQVHDFFEDRNRDVLVLELIRGKTLRELIKQNAVNDPHRILRQVVQALVAAHERGIAHQDLKPENVMITDDGEVKVLDFGLARIDQARGQKSQSDDSGEARLLAGTPGYMSPEQARGELATTAADLWSFGLLAIELLTGKRPSPEHASTLELLDWARQAQVEIPKGLPQIETQLLRGLLSEQPSARPSARETLNTLERIENRPRRRLIFTASAALILIALFSGWKYTTDLQQEQAIARAEQQKAEQARAEAEDLIGFMLDDLHAGLRSVGRLDLLESVATEAMNYYSEVDTERMRESNGKPAVAMARIAEVLDFQGRVDESLDLYNQARVALEQLHSELPDDELVAYRLGLVNMNLGEVHNMTANFDRSLQHSSQAIELGEMLTRTFAPGEGPATRPDARERWHILLRSSYRYADTHMRMGQPARAVELLEELVKIAVPAVDRNPGLLPDLADVQFKRCDSYYDAEYYDLVLEPCLATLEIDRSLHEANPDDFHLYSNFSMSHVGLTRVYRQLEKYPEALEMSERGIHHARQLVARDSENTSRLNDLALIFIHRGRVLYEMGEHEQSREYFLEALQILEPLSEDQEEVTVLNNKFTLLLHLEELEEATAIGKILKERGFQRREFVDLCNKFDIETCRTQQ